jgi:hypothetical protein
MRSMQSRVLRHRISHELKYWIHSTTKHKGNGLADWAASGSLLLNSKKRFTLTYRRLTVSSRFAIGRVSPLYVL